MLSWNVHGLPFRGGTPQRLERVAGWIREQQPDIVALQEVWLNVYRRILQRALYDQYDLVYEPRRFTRRPRGGLVVLIRRASGWQVSRRRAFTSFRETAPWYRLREADGVSGKGILTLELSDGRRSLLLTTTHLQAQYGPRLYQAERQAQIEQLTRALEHDRSLPHLIAGDFNTCADEPLYTTHLTPLGNDLTVDERRQATFGTHFDVTGDRNKWIDYAFGRNLPFEVELHRIINDAPDVPYSDHDGLFLRWTFPA